MTGLFQAISGYEAKNETEPPLYRLQRGDQLAISLYGEPRTSRLAAVDTTGHLPYLFLNKVPALGKTIEEIRFYLQEELKSYYLDPVPIISTVGIASNNYTIMGEVAYPGYRPIQGNTTLLSAIVQAGGFNSRVFREQTIDQEDLAMSFLVRNGEYVPVDFAKLVQEGDMSQDILLENGDYIYIATGAMRQVYVLGEVTNPLIIDFYETRLSLMDAIAYAGGVSNRASSRIVIIRGSLAYPIKYLVDFNLIKKGKAYDFPLEPGDIVYVPVEKFWTLKEVVRAGVAAFVGTLMSVAGTNTFVSITPAALGNVIQPVPVVNFTPGTSPISVPSIPATGG